MRRVAALVLLVLPAAADDDAAKIKLLIARLRSPDKRARATAAAELGDLGPRANGAINALAKALGDDDWWVRSRALEALKKIGPDAVPALVRAVAGSGKDRADIMRLLDESFAGELKPHLRTVAGLLRDRDQSTRRHAAHALGQQGEVAIDVLIPALGAREEGAQEAAIEALCGVGAIAIDPLLQTLAGGSDRARAGAALALGSLKASSAGEALVVALADKSQEVGGAAARGLGAAGAVPEQAIPLLFEGLRSPNAPFRE
ncbi:MAG: HEAT repeat domain-containing protein, partial [Planctomycetota bacterium]